jgi:hypothetical protein
MGQRCLPRNPPTHRPMVSIASSTNLLQQLADFRRRLYRPISRQPVWGWAEQHLTLSARSAEIPGPFSTSSRPYTREPMECFRDPSVTDTILCWGSQTAKTTTVMVGLIWLLEHEPSPILWLMPNKELAIGFVKGRWQPLLEEAAALAHLMPADRRRHYTLLEQHLGGSLLTFVGSNSPANLASRPIRVLIGDEVDKYAPATRKEDAALALAIQRTKAFGSSKHFLTSTPTSSDGDIWRHYLRGDRRRYHIPCPNCRELLTLEWAQVKWSNPTDGGEPRMEDGSWDTNLVRQWARYECQRCGGTITDAQKAAALRLGEWRATVAPRMPGVRSYHLSSLYAPDRKCSWAALACAFLEAKEALLGLQSFVNGVLAEPWDPDYEAEQVDGLELVTGSYRMGDPWPDAPVPPRLILTVDVQQSHFWAVVRAWAGPVSRLVWAGRLEDWASVRQLQTAHGIASGYVLVDATHFTAQVYQACCRWGWHALRGEDAPGGYLSLTPDRRTLRHFATAAKGNGVPSQLLPGSELRSCRLFLVSEALTSDVLAAYRAGDGAAWSIAADTPTDYHKQVLARVRAQIRNPRTGKLQWKWKTKGRQGEHIWDCERYQIAGAQLAGLLDPIQAYDDRRGGDDA